MFRPFLVVTRELGLNISESLLAMTFLIWSRPNPESRERGITAKRMTLEMFDRGMNGATSKKGFRVGPDVETRTARMVVIVSPLMTRLLSSWSEPTRARIRIKGPR